MNYQEIGAIDRSTFGRIEAARLIANHQIATTWVFHESYGAFLAGVSGAREAIIEEFSRDRLNDWLDAVNEKTRQAFLYTGSVDLLNEIDELIFKTAELLTPVNQVSEGVEVLANFVCNPDLLGITEELQIAQAKLIHSKLGETCKEIDSSDIRKRIEIAFVSAGQWVLDNCNIDSKPQVASTSKKRKPCEDSIRCGQFVRMKNREALQKGVRLTPRIKLVKEWSRKFGGSAASMDKKLQDNPDLWKDDSDSPGVSADKTKKV